MLAKKNYKLRRKIGLSIFLGTISLITIFISVISLRFIRDEILFPLIARIERNQRTWIGIGYADITNIIIVILGFSLIVYVLLFVDLKIVNRLRNRRC
jgi:hypothetical protein